MFEGIVATLLNRFLGNYVTNLETNQLKLGIWQGDVKLEKLRLKNDALDKLRLPVDIKEGWLGTLTISIPWSNLKGEPVRILIDNVYILATPRFQENFDPQREEEREYKNKMRRLENDDILRQQQQIKSKTAHSPDDEKKQASFTEQLITKIVDNLQVVIKNIHVRYEDSISNPDHMFAVGATLNELSAVSTDEEWRDTFLHDSSSVIHKMLKLSQFSVYWDTDCETMQGLGHNELIAQFAKELDAKATGGSHQSILQPVVGVGRLTMNKRPSPEDVRTMAKFEFDQLAFELDDEQYADVLFLTTAFDYAMRQRRYCKHRPPPGVRPKDDPRAWLMFAINSVYDEVHERNRRNTRQYMEERRESRALYIRLYSAFKSNHCMLPECDRIALEDLHRRLSYEDIRHYRTLAEPVIRKQQYLIRKRDSEISLASGKAANTAAAGAGADSAAGAGITGWVGGWVSSWITGTPEQAQDQGKQLYETADGEGAAGIEGLGDEAMQLSEKQVLELYEAIEFNEDEVVDTKDDDLPKDTIKLAVSAVLRTGSLKLKVDRKTRDHTLMGFMFDLLKIDLLQRPENLVVDLAMHRFEVMDGTLPNSQYPRMIYIHSDSECTDDINQQCEASEDGDEAMMEAVADAPKGLAAQLGVSTKIKDPFLQIHFEHAPLDGHADSVVNMTVKSLNVVYHPTAALAIIDFFEPPSSASADSINALIAAASRSMAGFRDQTRAGLEYALAKHKTVDVKVDFDAPVFVIPQDMLDPNSEFVVLDSGRLNIESQLVDSATTERLRQKDGKSLSPEEMKDLESLMYDHFDMRLHSTQLLVGNDLSSCMRALREGVTDRKIHVVDRIELNLDLGLCILSEPPVHMPKVTVNGSLPSLQVFFSDRKYKAIMQSIDLILEAIKDDEVDVAQQYETGPAPTAFGARGILLDSSDEMSFSGSSYTDIFATKTSSTKASDLQAQESAADDDNPSDVDSTDEFYETTEQISEAEPGVTGPASGKLRRKVNPEARTNVGKEPERVLVKVNFAIDNLVGFIWRTHTDGRDDLHLADVAVSGLAVECINRPFDLFADVTIHQVTVEDHLMTSAGGAGAHCQHVYALTSDIAQADANGETGKNLVAVRYHRCQADHPEFTTTYESIGQTVDVDISYLDLMVVRKTILTAYDYILKTFTDEDKQHASASSLKAGKGAAGAEDQAREAQTHEGAQGRVVHRSSDGSLQTSSTNNVNTLIQEALDTIRVDVRFKGTDFSLCHDDGSSIAVVSVTAATMRVIVTQEILLEAKIGNIMLTDQLDLVPMQNPACNETYGTAATRGGRSVDPKRMLLYIKGDELADLYYETFNPKSPDYPGHNAAIKLRLGSAHMTFVERPIRELMLFGSRFSAMHGLFEAARQAAAYGTTQLTEEMIGSGQKYHFDVTMLAPVIYFPRDGYMPYSSSHDDGDTLNSESLGVDMLISQPGELTISNEFTTVREVGKDWDVNHISLALRRIGIKTVFVVDEDSSDNGTFGQPGEQVLQILEDVDYRMDMHVLMQGHIPGCPRPVSELIGTLSPIKMKLTEYQYKMVYDLLGVIGRVFGTDPNEPVIPDPLIDDKTLDLDVLRENPATREAKSKRQALENLGQLSASDKAKGKDPASRASALLGGDESTGQYATVDLFVTLATIQLELFKGSGFDLDSVQEASFTRLDVNDLSVKYRSKENGDSKAELEILAVRGYDTRPGTENQFTQIISPTIGSQAAKSSGSDGAQTPANETATQAAQHLADGLRDFHSSMHAMAQDTPIEEDASSPQLICHVDMRPNQDMVVLVTLDSPRIVLVLDHMFMLSAFAMSVFPQQDASMQVQDAASRRISAPDTASSLSPTIGDGSAAAGDGNGLIYKVDILHPEIVLLANPKIRSSEALVMSINQIVFAQEGMFCATMDEICVFLCTIDRRSETSRSIMDPFTIITTMDSRIVPGDPRKGTQSHQISDISVDVGSLLLRLGLNDVVLMLDIFNKVVALMYKDQDKDGQTTAPEPVSAARSGPALHHTASAIGPGTAQYMPGSGVSVPGTPPREAKSAGAFGGSGGSTASAPTLVRPAGGSHQGSNARGSPSMVTQASARIVKETMRATIASLRLVVIRDMFGLPVYACTAKEFHVDVTDWSLNMQVLTDIKLQASYFNRRNSHWEPFIEPWGFSLNMTTGSVDSAGDRSQRIDINSTDRLLVNASHAFIEETLSLVSQWGDEVKKYEEHKKQGVKPIGERMPYVLVNRTGIDCHVWVDLPEGTAARTERIDTAPVLLRDGESLPWRFEDWRRRREQLEVKSHHLGIQFSNGQWEWLRRVQVDSEGVKHYKLQPALDDIQHRLAVEVKLDAVNLVKRVVLRSPLVVDNQTRVAMEIAMCDYRGELRTDTALIQPGDDLPLPIMFCHQYAIRVRPEPGFGYAWSSHYIYWRDFLAQGARTELYCQPQVTVDAAVKHQHQHHRQNSSILAGEANQSAASDTMPFYIHFNSLCDIRNPALYKYPFMRLVMTPPMEIENLLPYPMQLCVIDKTANRKWTGSLQRGGISSVHAVQPGHLTLLTVRIPDAGFERCEGTIIETNDDDEYPVDSDIVVVDRQGLKLALKLHRMDIPNSGGRCRRISIYAPYVMVNRTGLKLSYSSKGLFKGVSAVAGQNPQGNIPMSPQEASTAAARQASISSNRSSLTQQSRRLSPGNEFLRRQSGASSSLLGGTEDALITRPLMFSFGSYDFRNRALVRVGNSDWSRPLSFDTLGSASELVIPSASRFSDTHLGIEIEPGQGRYSHTRVVTFTSRYVVKNMTGMCLQYRTVYNTESAAVIENEERMPLHTLHKARRRLLTIADVKRNSLDQQPLATSVKDSRWSAPFSIDDVGRVFVRLPVDSGDHASAASAGRNEILVKIDIMLEGACLFVIMQRADEYWPYLVENKTSTDITIWQYLEKHHSGSGSGTNQTDSGGGAGGSQNAALEGTGVAVADYGERKYVVKAGQMLDYAWDVPTAATKLLVINAQGSTRRVSLQEIGEQRPFVYGKPPLPARRGTHSTAMTLISTSTAATLAGRTLADYTMNIEVAAVGPRQVLRLTGYTPENSLYAPQLQGVPISSGSRVTRTSTMQSTMTRKSSSSADDRFEVVEADEKTKSVFRVGLEGGIGISVINRYSSEIMFATLSDVELKYTDSTSNQTYKLTVKWIQVDNQIYGALYPIVVYPTTLGVAAAGISSPPALQAVVVHAKDNSYGVEYFKYASVLMQELSVELDEDFLYALLDFVKIDVPGWSGSKDGEGDTSSIMLESDIPEVDALDEGLQLYFEFLHIQPFKLNISFMRTQRLDVGGDPTRATKLSAQALSSTANSGSVPGASSKPGSGSGGGIVSYSTELGLMGGTPEQTGEGVASNSGVVAYAMNVLTMAIGNINEAPVFLNALIMQNVRVSMPILLDRMQKHYSQEVFNQVYKVVGSANVLGNPVGLFNSISSGVSDFFYEPYQGFVMSDRPQDFGFGLARGTASLFKKTVFGMTDSFSKFTDSMSKGLSAATMDPRYQTERSMSRVRNKPKHAIYGVARGAESFAKSVGSGIAGVVMRPLEGAEQEGVGGFFKGVGKGLVGVVTKPVIGMFDLASNVTEGIRNTTTVFERDLDRQRLPRQIGRDGIITLYSSREALGQAWMRELNKGTYAYDDYLAHLELPGSDMVVLLTYQRLVMFRRAKPDEAGMAVGAAGSSAETGNATGAIGISAANASKAQVEWEQEIKSLHSIQLEATGISLKLPATPEGYVPPGPFIPVSDAQGRRWFYDKIRDAVKALIDHRKELG
ncbi:Vacuolar protein sorting-associated protein 13 [Coemansia sp. RSA 1646]|nr:Vacuolar protein sorting-associated protein 13 [Coemansia sp. RSA 1646]